MSKIHGCVIEKVTVHCRNYVPFRWTIVTNGMKMLFENDDKSPIWGDMLPSPIQRFCFNHLISSRMEIEHESIPLLNAEGWIETISTYK